MSVESKETPDDRISKYIYHNLEFICQHYRKTLTDVTSERRANLTCEDKDGSETVAPVTTYNAGFYLYLSTLKGKINYTSNPDILKRLTANDLVECYFAIYVQIGDLPDGWLTCANRYITFPAPRVINTRDECTVKIFMTRLPVHRVFDSEDDPGKKWIVSDDFMLYNRKGSAGRETAFSFQGNNPAENPDSPLFLMAMQTLAPVSTYIVPVIVSQNTVQDPKDTTIQHIQRLVRDYEARVRHKVRQLAMLYYIEFDAITAHVIACVMNKETIEIIDTIAQAEFHKPLFDFAKTLQTSVFDDSFARISAGAGIDHSSIQLLFTGADAPFLQKYELAQRCPYPADETILRATGGKGQCAWWAYRMLYRRAVMQCPLDEIRAYFSTADPKSWTLSLEMFATHFMTFVRLFNNSQTSKEAAALYKDALKKAQSQPFDVPCDFKGHIRRNGFKLKIGKRYLQ